MATSEKDRQRELENKRSQKSGYEKEKAAYESKISSNKKKIERLRAAKKSLGEIKTRLEAAAKSQKKTAENEDTYYDWVGDKRTTVQNISVSDVPTEYTYYINRVDIVLDTIVDEETELENENLEMNGIVGQLGSWINSLIGEIEKLCN